MYVANALSEYEDVTIHIAATSNFKVRRLTRFNSHPRVLTQCRSTTINSASFTGRKDERYMTGLRILRASVEHVLRVTNLNFLILNAIGSQAHVM